MASKMEVSIETLKMSLGNQNPVETLRQIEAIVQLFDDDGGMTGPEIDLGISKLFDVQQGMLTFLVSSIKCNKVHRASNCKVLELFDRLIGGTHREKVVEYAPAIVEVMLQFVHSSSVSAMEKELSTVVVKSLVGQRMCGEVPMDEVLVQLLQVFHNAKATGKFLQHVYELLGLVARNYPETMEDGKDYPIRNMFLKTLESVLLTQKEISFASINGAFTGLNHFLVNYAPSPTDEPAVCHRIYVCVKKLSDPPAGFGKLHVYKASLDLLATHAPIVGVHVFADNRYWHDVLQRWLQNTTNRDYRKTIFQALNAVHSVIAQTCEAVQEDADVATHETETLRFYVGHFKATLLAAASTPADIRVAIRGLGLMAGACHRRLPSANLADLLTLVMQRTESLCPSADGTNAAVSRATLEHYPDFVRALSQIMQHVRQLTNVQLNTLQTILVSLMRDFCYLPAMYTRLTVAALLQTFARLVHIGDAVLDRLLSQCTMRAIVWTCSHKLLLDSHNDWERQQDWKDHITVESFKPMWLGLTCDNHTTEAGVVVEDAAEIRVIKRHMYRHLMDVFFVIIERLELSVRPRRTQATATETFDANDTEPSYVADPNRDLEPVRPADFHLFFNFVQLFEQLLPAQSQSAQRDIFAGYAGRFCEVLSRKCTQHPLVSGFVRLMTAGLRVCRRLEFFDSSHHHTGTVALVQRFAAAQMAQVARTQGEMQIACLHCLFALPAQFLENCSSAELVTVYRSAFAVGHGELHVARASLRSLAWLVERSPVNVDDVLRGVLPCLDGYLQSSDGVVGEVGERQSVGKQRNQRRAKRLLRVNVRDGSDTELVQFQKRVLMFLGTLQPHHCLHLIDDSAADIHTATNGDPDTRHDHRPITRPQIDDTIQLTLHFGDLEPRVHLDALVPRICSLATDASDRSTKIAACELLHSMVLYLIGTRQFESAMWRTLCAQMLVLGSDGDVAVRQMFEPLLEQIMHYMSHPAHLTVASLRLLLGSLMDGVADRRAAGVRDLSARCIRVFVEWTMRQNSPSSAMVVGEIVAALRLHSFDSAGPRRRGAALAFNSIYRIVREQDALVDAVWLDVLYTFAMNYQLSEQFGGAQDATHLQQVDAALEHVLRVLRERSDVFAGPNAGRTVPVGFERATLADAVGWLLTQCGATQMRYRRKCIGMVQQLAPLVNGSASVRAYLQATQTTQTLLAVVQLSDNDLQAVDEQRLLAAIDFYIWIVGDALADGAAELLVQSKVIRTMARFLNSVQTALVSDPLTECHSLCVERSLEFIMKLLPVHAQVFADEQFWTECGSSLTKIVSRLVFSPHDAPFVVAQRCCDEFLADYPRICSAQMVASIRTHFDAELRTRYEELLHTTEMYLHSTIIPMDMLNSARGISAVLAAGNNTLQHDPAQLIRQLFEGLCDQRLDEACAHQLLPDVRAFAQTVMRITFHGRPFEQLIECIFDATPLVQPELRSVILHGQHFVNVFSRPIFEYALREPQATFAAIRRQLSAANAMFVTDLVRDIVQFVVQSSARRHDRVAAREIGVNISLIFTHLMTLHAALAASEGDGGAEWTAMSFVIVELVTHAALIWPDTLISLGQQFEELPALLVDLIASRAATLELKARAIFLLPCLMDTLTETHATVEPALASLQEHHFPLLSTEYPDGSLERAGYVNVLQALLDAMVASRSPALLRFVVRCTAADDRHIMEYALRTALTAFSGAIGGGGATHALSVLRIPFEMFGDQRMEPGVRLNVVKRFVLPMLRSCGVEALVKFFGQYLSTVIEWADTNYGLAASGWAVEQALVNRIGAFRLIEVLVGGVDKERLTDPELLKSITVPTKSLISLLTTKIMATRSDIFVSDDAAATELFRHYNCATFTAICTLVANTQTELRFYELVFRENTRKNEYIWRKLVDCRDSALYSHRMAAEFTELPKQKERLVSIQAAGGSGSSAGRSDRLQTQSQKVFESSFSQDVTRIDLSNSTVRNAEQLRHETAINRTVELERDAINDHEVMACLCAVVRTMFEKNMTPLPSATAEGEKARLAPQWAKHLCTVLEDNAQPRNARYFIAKLVDNCREHFAHYAQSMTGSLLAFLADECALAADAIDTTQDTTGSVNYFIIDLTVTLLEWSDRYKLHTVEEIHSAGAVLKFLMANAWHARRDVFRQRLEVIRSLLVAWSPVVQLPQQLLVDALNRTQRPDSRDNLCGLQLNAVVLCSCDQLPWTERVCAEYVRCVMISLDNEHSSVYQPAAFLLGMVLHRLIPPEDDTDDHALLQTVRNKLKHMHGSRNDEKRFTDILFAVHRHYPRIVASFLVPIANLIPKSSGTVKRNYLVMFLAAMDAYGADVFRELLALGLLNLLRSVEFELQALHCVNKALPHMSDAQTQSIWTDVCACARSRNADTRTIAVEIFVYVLVNALDADLQTAALAQVLRGFSDADARIRERVFEFWSNCDQLPQRIEQRLLGVLDILYNPGVEEQFIGYGTQLLLQVAIQSARAKQQIFPHQSVETVGNGGGAALAEYEIDVSWSGRNSSMRAPMFLQSQQQRTQARTETGMFLATAADSQLAFEPTQDPATLRGGTEASQFTSAASSTQSSMLFAVPRQLLDRRSHRVETTPAPSRSSYAWLRERFLSDKDATARKWVDRSRTKQAVRATAAPAAGHRRVQLYRRYRTGDFPDLLINNLAFLLPLQALVQHDRPLASQLFVALYTTIAGALDPGASRPFLLASSDSVQMIFRRTKHCDPLVFSTLMQLAMQHPQHFELPVELVAQLAITNRNIALAIGYLERRLHFGWNTEGPGSSAKSNASTIDLEQQHWLKLTELYRALAEPDVVAGIFAEKLDVDGRIPRALALESVGDFESAQRMYLEAINRGKKLEKDFAYQSYYELYACMGDWSALAATCDGQLDNAEELWTDDWMMDNVLPYMMRARCRQVLRGDADSREFVQRLEQWVRVPDRADHLNVQFGEELMMMHMAAGQVRHARVYGDRRLTAFLAEWPTVNVLTRKVRAEKVLGIRTVAEMLHSADQLLTKDAVGLARLAERWESDRPHGCDSARLWDTMVAYRGCVAGAVPSPDAALRKRMDDAVAAAQFRVLSLALSQGNVALANRIVQVVPRQQHELRWQVTRAEHQSLKAGRQGRSADAQCKLQLKAWDGVVRVLDAVDLDSADLEVRLKALEVYGDIAQRLVKTEVVDAALIRQIASRLGDEHMPADRLRPELHRLTFYNLNKRVQCVDGQPDGAATPSATNHWFDGQDRGTVHYQLATFCRDQHANAQHRFTVPDCERLIIESLFKAMQFGCAPARQMFPRILDLPALHTSAALQRTFDEATDRVPEWMFLGWIPQMMSVFTFDEPCFLDALLQRLARAYPLAVYHPFHLSYQRRLDAAHFAECSDDKTALRGSDSVRELLHILHDPAMEAFVQALLCLCVPEKRLHQHLCELLIELDTCEHEDDDADDRRRLQWRVRRLLLLMWPARQQRGRAYERLEAYRGELMALQSVEALSDVRDSVHALIKRLEEDNKRQKVHRNDTLRTLSPWLAAFQWCGQSRTTGDAVGQLELPGQYSGTRQPNVAEHVRIIKFDERIRIFETLRQPIRLRICGTDGRTYSYLLKYGEDLRQDQRVQQLLALMFDRLRADVQCRAHALRLETYAVVPLSVNCGLLGWVDDSPAMQSVVEQWLQRRQRSVAAEQRTSAEQLLRSLRVEHDQFIAAEHGGDRPGTERRKDVLYGRAAARYSREQLQNGLRTIEYKLPTELLRSALWDMAASAEAFYALRSNFASSLAALSVAHWLLGVGDRHLSNVLLNERTARVVGIDFGLTFGAGTRDQNVPELLPFRMTPQLVQAMNPLGVCGAVTMGMTHALRCLRESHQLLESCMEVFVREPTIDWLQSARNRELAANDEADNSTDIQWDPAQRLAIARRKLRGANPRVVCEDELCSGKIARYPEYLAGYRRLVKGHAQHNVRSQMADDGLTAAEQVRCLLDMATDAALLSISYTGMQMWI